jgi:hypothetical protein
MLIVDFSYERFSMNAAFFQQTGTTMNNLIRIVTAIIVLCIGSFRAGAEEWSYTGCYPYVYAPSSDTWYYFPDSPPLVWNYSSGEWAANPFGERSFDIRKTFEQYPLSLYMVTGDGGYHMGLWFNWSGIEYATFTERELDEDPSYDSRVYCRYVLNEKNGTCVMHGDFLDGSGYSFTIILNFDNDESGTFTITGMFPFLTYTDEGANHIGTLEGTFTIGQIIID